ncbi:MAG: glycosyltransferase, partial [Candidatus Zixiibacteriota bacterium]
ALTLAEITTCGLPSILIPYPFAAGNHQKKNAQDYEARGMAVLIDEKSLDNTDIITDAVTLLKSDRYQQMKQAIIKENRGKEPAVDIIAKDIIKQLESIKQDGGED